MIASCDNPKSEVQNPKWKDGQALKDAVGEWSDRIKVQVKQIQSYWVMESAIATNNPNPFRIILIIVKVICN